MYVQELKLYNFRNLGQQEVSLSPRLNFFVGQNGQGKTNFVEALFFASLGRSFRTSKASDLVAWGEKEASVFAKVAQADTDIELGVSIERGRRQPFVNGEKVSSLGDYMGKLVCVGFSPGDLELVRGGPAERRKFLDRHLSELKPQLVNDFVSYHKTLKTKNKILKSSQGQRHELLTLNALLARYSLPILIERRRFVEELRQEVMPIHQKFCGQDGELSLTLKSTVSDDILESGEEAVAEFYSQNLEREMRVKKTVSGPHRDELLLCLAGKEARSFASQGQTRGIVLSLKLSVIQILERKLGDSPVVLLDDVESELDARRRGVLFDMIFEQGRQVLITGTEASQTFPESSECAYFQVESGKFSPRNQALMIANLG